MADMAEDALVVIGGGVAGLSGARTLKQLAPTRRVVLIAEEPHFPYDRTTLSKPTVMGSGADPPAIWPPGDPSLAGVHICLGRRATAIDPLAKVVRLDGGDSIGYDQLLLATGASPRVLPGGMDQLQAVHYLRRREDAIALHADLVGARSLVVIGGGVIGLEVAATARTLGLTVTVVEAGARIMGRYLPDSLAADVSDLHRSHGVRLLVGAAPARLRSVGERVTAVELTTGEILAADVVVIGIGVLPRQDLAADAGLLVDDGIVVDARGRSSDLAIWAAGDVARIREQPQLPGLRTESWYAAAHQGEAVAANLLGAAPIPPEVPWTWSDQFDVTLQIAGAPGHDHERHRFESTATGAHLTLETCRGRLMCAYGLAVGGLLGKAMRAARILLADGWAFAPVGPAPDLEEVTRVLVAAARRTRSLAR